MQIQESIFIQAAPEDIYRYLIDVENRKEYIPLLDEVIIKGDGPLQVGSQYIEVATIAGRQLRTTYEITHMVDPQLISVKTVESIFPIMVDIYLELIDEETKLSLQVDFTLSGIYRIGAPVVNRIVEHQSKSILRRLKYIIEAT